MDAELTLLLDQRLIEAAVQHASDHSTSVSRLVESYLKSLTAQAPKAEFEISPFVKSISTEVELPADLDHKKEYFTYLVEKYSQPDMPLLDSHPDPLQLLSELSALARSLPALQFEQVTAAREAGNSWEEIGHALGVTPQEAYHSFAAASLDAAFATTDKTHDLSEEEAMTLAVEETKAVRNLSS